MSKTGPDHSQADPVRTDTDQDLLIGPKDIGPDLGPTGTGPDLGHTDNSPDPGQADTGPDLVPTDTSPDPSHTHNSPYQGQDLGYKGKTRKLIHDIQCPKKVSLFG